MRLLDKIALSSTDRLFIIGDIIDRGPDTRRLLRWLITEAPKNIIMLKGNHEDMLASYLTCIVHKDEYIRRSSLMNHPWLWNCRQQKDVWHIEDDRHDWFWYDMVLPYLRELPLYADIIVKDTRFVLVHAGFNPRQWDKNARWYRQDALLQPGADMRQVTIPQLGCQDAQDMLWTRDGWFDRTELDPVHIICGHTGTLSHHLPSLRLAEATSNLVCDIRPCQICHMGTRHFIDCGSAYRNKYHKADIGILRLDDLASFYLKTPSPVYPTNEYLSWFYN
jgi:hypothetical protein